MTIDVTMSTHFYIVSGCQRTIFIVFILFVSSNDDAEYVWSVVSFCTHLSHVDSATPHRLPSNQMCIIRICGLHFCRQGQVQPFAFQIICTEMRHRETSGDTRTSQMVNDSNLNFTLVHRCMWSSASKFSNQCHRCHSIVDNVERVLEVSMENRKNQEIMIAVASFYRCLICQWTSNQTRSSCGDRKR